jgi:hypothetical protein
MCPLRPAALCKRSGGDDRAGDPVVARGRLRYRCARCVDDQRGSARHAWLPRNTKQLAMESGCQTPGTGVDEVEWQRGQALLQLAPGRDDPPRPSPTAVGRRQVSFPTWLAGAGRSQQAGQATRIAARLLPVGMSRMPTVLARERFAWSWLTRPPVIRGFALCLPLPNRRSVDLLRAGNRCAFLALLRRPCTGPRRDISGTAGGRGGVGGEDTPPRLLAHTKHPEPPSRANRRSWVRSECPGSREAQPIRAHPFALEARTAGACSPSAPSVTATRAKGAV